jgi:PPM family protein phosphatase
MIIPSYHFLTDRGKIRVDNEDFYFTPDGFDASLLDLKGGHTSGQTASRMICKALAEFYQNRLPDDGSESWETQARITLASLIERISKYVYGCRYLEEQRYVGMGSTLTGALIRQDLALIFNIGDSRVYHLSGTGGFYQVSRDHSKVQALIDHGLITQEGAENHPDVNVITRSIGMAPTKDDGRPDIKSVKLAAGDQLLLCSDGLSSMVPHDKLAASMLLAGRELERAANELLNFALDAGGHDNITIGLVQMVPEQEEPQSLEKPATEHAVSQGQERKMTMDKGEEHGKNTD